MWWQMVNRISRRCFRFIVGYGVFDPATTENALAVLEEAIKNRGKPTAILTDRETQFCKSEVKKREYPNLRCG